MNIVRSEVPVRKLTKIEKATQKHVNAAEMAATLDRSTSTIIRYLQQTTNPMPGHKIGGRWDIPFEDALRWAGRL